MALDEWHIAEEGIKLDLEWMHRVGIASFQNFDVALQTPQVVEKKHLAYMTPEWKEAFRYAINLGDQLGMEMAIAGSPGWSETVLVGGKLFSGKLAHPPNNTGAFQDLGVREEFGRSAGPPPQQ